MAVVAWAWNCDSGSRARPQRMLAASVRIGPASSISLLRTSWGCGGGGTSSCASRAETPMPPIDGGALGGGVKPGAAAQALAGGGGADGAGAAPQLLAGGTDEAGGVGCCGRPPGCRPCSGEGRKTVRLPSLSSLPLIVRPSSRTRAQA